MPSGELQQRRLMVRAPPSRCPWRSCKVPGRNKLHSAGLEQDFIADLRRRPVAEQTVAANEQHYEVPTEFYLFCLGRNLKYSSCLYKARLSSPALLLPSARLRPASPSACAVLRRPRLLLHPAPSCAAACCLLVAAACSFSLLLLAACRCLLSLAAVALPLGACRTWTRVLDWTTLRWPCSACAPDSPFPTLSTPPCVSGVAPNRSQSWRDSPPCAGQCA